MADLEASLTDIGWLSNKLQPALCEEKPYMAKNESIMVLTEDLSVPHNSDSSTQLMDELICHHSNDIVSSSTPLEKPGHSYANLITMAIRSSPQFKMTLSDIYAWISETFPFYKQAGPGWKNSIRHNLSLNKCFVKLERSKAETGKGSYWTICDDSLDEPGAVRVKQRIKTSPYYTNQKSDPQKMNNSFSQESYNVYLNSTSTHHPQMLNPYNIADITSTTSNFRRDFSFIGQDLDDHQLVNSKFKSNNSMGEEFQLDNTKYKLIKNQRIIDDVKSKLKNDISISSTCLKNRKNHILNLKSDDLIGSSFSNLVDSSFLNADNSFIDSTIDLDSSFGFLLNSVYEDNNDGILGIEKLKNIDWLKDSFVTATNLKWDNIDLTQFPSLAESIRNADWCNWNLDENGVIDMAASLHEFFRLQQSEKKLASSSSEEVESNQLAFNNQIDPRMPTLSPQITSSDEIEDDFDWDKII